LLSFTAYYNTPKHPFSCLALKVLSFLISHAQCKIKADKIIDVNTSQQVKGLINSIINTIISCEHVKSHFLIAECIKWGADNFKIGNTSYSSSQNGNLFCGVMLLLQKKLMS